MDSNPQKELREQLAGLTPEQKDEMLNELAGTPQKAKPRSKYADPGTLRRKKILKGKMAPQGCVYLVLTVRTKLNKVYAYQLLPGGLGEEAESEIADSLRELINKKYHV